MLLIIVDVFNIFLHVVSYYCNFCVL